MKKALLLILVIMLISCKSNKKGFTITVFTSNLPDSTKVYLRNTSSSVVLDSAMIFNNIFHFQGIVDSLESYTIHTMNFQDYRSLWIDNSDITLDASESSLRMGKISGSDFQNLNSQYLELDGLFKTKMDSLNSEIRNTKYPDSIKRIELQREKDAIVLDRQDAILGFIRNNPDFYLNPYYLEFLMFTQPKQVTENMYNAMSVSAKESIWGKAVLTFLNRSADLKTGDRAIDFSLPDIKGNLINLQSFRNKYVLLEFWASWCGPCRQDNRDLLKLYRKYRNDGFEILGVTLDKQKSVWESTVLSDTMLWTTVSDLKGDFGDVPIMYRVYGLPSNYLIDPQGIIIDIDLRGTALSDKLETIFKN